MLAWGFILLGSLAWLGSAHPIETDVQSQWLLQEVRTPMVLTRGQPNPGGQLDNPQMAIEAHATGDTVAASSIKHEYKRSSRLVEAEPEGSEPDREEPRSAEEPAPQDQEIPAEEDDTKVPAVPQRKPKTSERRPVKDDDDDDDDEDDDDDDSVSRKGRRPGGSIYRNFFPMTFGAKLRLARDADDVQKGSGGGVRSIANSFSTGRGAVASSSAKAYGSPSTSQDTIENKLEELRM